MNEQLKDLLLNYLGELRQDLDNEKELMFACQIKDRIEAIEFILGLSPMFFKDRN